MRDWHSALQYLVLIPGSVVQAFGSVGKLVLATRALYSRTVYVLEEALCRVTSNSSVVLLHSNRKAGVSIGTLNSGVKFI